MKNIYTAGILAIVAGCATQRAQSTAAYRIETPVIVNGHEIARTTTEAGPTGRCVDNLSLHTDERDERIQYSILETMCDNNDDGVPDFSSLTRIGMGETEPYSETVVISYSNQVTAPSSLDMVRRGEDCLVTTYDMANNARTGTQTREVVKCSTLANE